MPMRRLDASLAEDLRHHLRPELFAFVGGAGVSLSSSFRVVLNWFDQRSKP
mgnify:CR=1 FL=1